MANKSVWIINGPFYSYETSPILAFEDEGDAHAFMKNSEYDSDHYELIELQFVPKGGTVSTPIYPELTPKGNS